MFPIVGEAGGVAAGEAGGFAATASFFEADAFVFEVFFADGFFVFEGFFAAGCLRVEVFLVSVTALSVFFEADAFWSFCVEFFLVAGFSGCTNLQWQPFSL